MRHGELLGCSFVHDTSSAGSWRLSPPLSPDRKLNPGTISGVPARIKPDSPSPETVTQPRPSPVDQHIKTLARGRSSSAKAAALSALLSYSRDALKRTSKPLIFHFQGHPILMPASTFSRPQPTLPPVGALPVLAFLDRLDIHRSREASLEYIRCPSPSRRPSNPTARLYEKRLAQITPSNPLQDPYILAMLLALAQSQQRQCARVRLLSMTQSFQVHVVVSDVKDKSHLVLYTADVPAVFLDRLASPHKRPRAASNLVVRSINIPFQPYSSLPERLTHAVVPPRPKRSQDPDPMDEETRASKRRKTARQEQTETGHNCPV